MPSYRHLMRVEGLTLAAFGLVATVAVLAAAPSATDSPLSTVGQLAGVLVLMLAIGGRRVLRALSGAVELTSGGEGTGEPTNLWQVPLVVAALTLGFGFGAGWDAALRVGGGCVIIGLMQGVAFERFVAARERRGGCRYFRVPGSRTITGTRLGWRAGSARDRVQPREPLG